MGACDRGDPQGGAWQENPTMAPVMGESHCPLERNGLQQQGMMSPVRSQRVVNIVAIDWESVVEGNSMVEGEHPTGGRPGV